MGGVSVGSLGSNFPWMLRSVIWLARMKSKDIPGAFGCKVC